MQLIAELSIAARRLAQHRVHDLETRVGGREKGAQPQRIDLNQVEHHLDVRVCILWRFLHSPCLPGEHDCGSGIGHATQDVLDPLRAHDAIEGELQETTLPAAPSLVRRDFELTEWVDVLDQVLSALAPEQLDVLLRRSQGIGRYQILQQVFERQTAKIRAAKQAGQRVGPHARDAVLGVEKEYSFLDRLQNLAGLFLSFENGALETRTGELQVRCERAQGDYQKPADCACRRHREHLLLSG